MLRKVGINKWLKETFSALRPGRLSLPVVWSHQLVRNVSQHSASHTFLIKSTTIDGFKTQHVSLAHSKRSGMKSCLWINASKFVRKSFGVSSRGGRNNIQDIASNFRLYCCLYLFPSLEKPREGSVTGVLSRDWHKLEQHYKRKLVVGSCMLFRPLLSTKW